MCKYENMKMRKYENEVRKNEIGSNGRNYAAPIHRGVFFCGYILSGACPDLAGRRIYVVFQKRDIQLVKKYYGIN
jgi:hypothetical protein